MRKNEEHARTTAEAPHSSNMSSATKTGNKKAGCVVRVAAVTSAAEGAQDRGQSVS